MWLTLRTVLCELEEAGWTVILRADLRSVAVLVRNIVFEHIIKQNSPGKTEKATLWSWRRLPTRTDSKTPPEPARTAPEPLPNHLRRTTSELLASHVRCPEPPRATSEPLACLFSEIPRKHGFTKNAVLQGLRFGRHVFVRFSLLSSHFAGL